MSLLQEIRKPGEVVTLDFSRKEHREIFCQLYGGEETMKNRLPLFYRAYQKTAALHEEGKGLAYTTFLQLDEENRETFTDGIDISCVNYTVENNMLYAEGITSLVNTADFIDEHIEIQTAAGETVYGASQSTANTYTSSIKVNTPFNPREFQSCTLLVDYMVTWIDGQTKLLKAQLYSREANEKYYLTNCVENINLKFPYSKQNENVIVCYNRQPTVKEKVDRTYQQAIHGNVQKLFLDVQADVKFKSSSSGFAGIDPTTFVLKLASRGMAQYKTAGRMDEIAKRFVDNGQGFSFSLDSDWQDDVPTARLPLWDLVDIQMYAAFNLNDGTQSDFTISSTVDQSQSNVCKAQKMYLLWGCLAEDSLIRMADGSDHRIQDICVGDSVMLENAETGRVTNVWKGTEQEPLICLSTEEGSVCCTRLHPVKTAQGVKRAEDIVGSDCLITGEGREVPLNGIYPVAIDTVYNLDILNETTQKEDGALLICEGFLVGDNKMQNMQLVALQETPEDTQTTLECARKNRLFAERGKDYGTDK